MREVQANERVRVGKTALAALTAWLSKAPLRRSAVSLLKGFGLSLSCVPGASSSSARLATERAMSRLTQLGSDVPVYFPSIVSAAAEPKQFTPSPPQKARHYAKKQHHGDARVQLEPLRPSLNGGGTSARLSVSSSSGRISWGSKELDAASTIGENVATFQELDRKLQFYKQLAAIKLRQVVTSEDELLHRIDGVLQAASIALEADVVVLYAVDDQSGALSVTASTRSNLVGLQIPREHYVLRDHLVVSQDEDSAESQAAQSEPLYVPNLHALETYEFEIDVDSRSTTTERTRSTMMATIADEIKRTIFIVEVRSAREISFSMSLFTAAVTAIENIAFAFDLKEEHEHAILSSAALENVLHSTLKPPSSRRESIVAATEPSDQDELKRNTPRKEVDRGGGSKLSPLVSAALVEATGLEMDELQYLQSPNAQLILAEVLAHSRFTGVCFIELHTVRRSCEVLSSCGATGLDVLEQRRAFERLLSPRCCDVSSDETSVTQEEESCRRSDALFHRLVDSTERRMELDLLDDATLCAAFSPLELTALVFLPVPSSLTTRSAGVLCISTDSSATSGSTPHSFTVRSLTPFLSSLALAHVLKKKDDDMRTSTLQKKKLINLFQSHFQLESINDPATLVNTICNVGSDLFNTSRVTLYVADAIKNELWSLSSLGSVNGLRIPYGKGISGTVAATKDTLIVRNPYDDPRFDRSFDVKFGFKTESLLTFPVLDKNSETLAVIQAVNFHDFLDAETAAGNPLLAKFDERLLDVYKNLVSHALRVNSSLITFAKVQADYWVNRAGLVDTAREGGASDGSGTDGSGSAAANANGTAPGQIEVASVHSLLDSSGFDETKRVPRNKWSTFAYACWALGGFLLLASRQRYNRQMLLEEQLLEQSEHDDSETTGDNDVKGGTTNETSQTREPPLREASAGGLAGRIRSRSRTTSVIRASRANSLINRWRRQTMEHTDLHNELLSDTFDPLSRSILELEASAFLLFDGLMLISTFRIEAIMLRTFISTLARHYRSVPYHSFYHGFDVALTSYCLVRRTGVLTVIKELEALSLMIAALGHDADHPGNDNQFEIDSGSPLALCYNDISVLENHHAATTFAVLRSKSLLLLPAVICRWLLTAFRCALALNSGRMQYPQGPERKRQGVGSHSHCSLHPRDGHEAPYPIAVRVVSCEQSGELRDCSRRAAAHAQHDHSQRGSRIRGTTYRCNAEVGRPRLRRVHRTGEQVGGTRAVCAASHCQSRGGDGSLPTADELHRLPGRAALDCRYHHPPRCQALARQPSHQPRLFLRACCFAVSSACCCRRGTNAESVMFGVSYSAIIYSCFSSQ